MLAAVERAFRLADGADAEGGSHHEFEVEPQRRELRRIDLDPDRRVLQAADSDQSDAWHLRELLREDAVGVVADLGQRKRLRGEGELQIGVSRGWSSGKSAG